MPISQGFLHDCAADYFGDLRDDRVAECPKSVHPSGNLEATRLRPSPNYRLASTSRMVVVRNVTTRA